MFRLTQSPFVPFEATVQYHLQNYINTLKELVKQIMKDLYVDGLITGRDKLTDVEILKDTAIQYSKKQDFPCTNGTHISLN